MSGNTEGKVIIYDYTRFNEYTRFDNYLQLQTPHEFSMMVTENEWNGRKIKCCCCIIDPELVSIIHCTTAMMLMFLGLATVAIFDKHGLLDPMVLRMSIVGVTFLGFLGMFSSRIYINNGSNLQGSDSESSA